jgi:hypothetical protein
VAETTTFVERRAHRTAGPLAGRGLTLTAGVAAALPVLVTTVRALADGWMPVGDQGIIATRAYDVFTTHTPLLGQFSQASRVVGHALYSPGPTLYWLLAIPSRIGAPAGLMLVTAAVNTASILAIVALARRRGGPAFMLAVALALALMSRSFPAESLHGIFNPAAALFPFTLLIFVCWSLACGDHRLLPAAVLLASFCAQCHLAFVLPGAGLLAVGFAGLALSRAGRRRSPVWPWIAAAAATATICWTPAIVDQVKHSPGNLHLLAKAATASQKTEGATAAWRGLVRVLGVPPRWLRAPQSVAGHLGNVSGGDYGDTRLSDISTKPSAIAAGSAIVVLCALVAATIAALRGNRRDLALGALIGLVLCAAFAAMVASTPADAVNTLGYTMWWGSPAGMWAWLIVAWSAVELIDVRRRVGAVRLPRFAPAAGAGLVALAGGAIAASRGPDAHAPFYRPVRDVEASLNATVPRGRTVLLVQRGSVVVPVEPAVRYALRRRNVRALGRGAVRPGAWYALDNRRYEEVVSLYADSPPPIPSARLVGRFDLTNSSGRHTIDVALSPPGSPAVSGREAGRRPPARPFGR